MQTVPHTFHIPVLGLGYSIDTPAKVAQYGISSVISLVDDILMEKLREMYCHKFELPFQSISEKIEDYRAKRITAYLDTIQEVVRRKFEKMKGSVHQKEGEIEKYIRMLPDFSQVKQKFNQFVNVDLENMRQRMGEWVNENLHIGDIDVNIMSKLDRANTRNGETLPDMYNDAHAALRGFANSTLHSSLVLSAGMNPRLYSYLEEFDDFYPDAEGSLKKKITLKVSDYRSALIQGRFLAKKGIWVSEYRVESGLNCGGHAFATEGFLLGPVLEEFKNNREELQQVLHETLVKALQDKGRPVPEQTLPLKLTAQGGVGTAGEHRFLCDYYQLDSVGWGTPFMLVPEAVNIDDQTLELLCNAKEEDLYLSHVSPLGVLFNNVRGNSKDREKMRRAKAGKPGFSCTKKFLALNEDGICTASKQYLRAKTKELQAMDLPEEEYDIQYAALTDKTCLCKGLSASAYQSNGLESNEGPDVSVCPGPNLAYFSKPVSLETMVGHIYGRTNIVERNDRPNLFLKELKMYIDYLGGKIDETLKPLSEKQKKVFENFQENLQKGIDYYRELFQKYKKQLEKPGAVNCMMQELEKLKEEVAGLKVKLG
ncbi:MAG: hypothetical protein RBS73_06565 [Prolixibacteraceae bacterium]|jgi:hypothetical protein|nr:hypothetical protein [Prolixibacteraceae bacterium]